MTIQLVASNNFVQTFDWDDDPNWQAESIWAEMAQMERSEARQRFPGFWQVQMLCQWQDPSYIWLDLAGISFQHL